MPNAFRQLHWARHIEIENYFMPETLQAAIDLLEQYKGRARVVAGGTDVIPELRSGDSETQALVDITRLPEMDYIGRENDKIVLGGLVTHARAASSDLLMESAPLLADGARSVGSPQIRNIATVAGNLISGQPAADTSIPLLALDASVVIASKQGQRSVALSDFFLGVGKTVLDSTKEILTRIEFSGLGEDEGGSYLRLSMRKALTLPMLVCAVKVRVNRNKDTIMDTAIAAGPVAPTPLRLTDAENQLKGAPANFETVRKAAEAASGSCSPRDSLLRGSSEYRREMVKVFVRRGLVQALERAGAKVR